MNQYVDAIYYINLDHRTDRNEECLAEFQKMGISSEKIVRIPAIRKEGQGDLGCSLSHIKALETFLASPHQNCIVLEDDFTFIEDISTVDTVLTQFFTKGVEYDVCLLSANTEAVVEDHPEHPFLKKVIKAYTASGYMLSRQFANILLDNFKEGAALLDHYYKENDISGRFTCMLDVYWRKLQPSSRWYIFCPKFGKQRPSWSDIQNHFEDYKY